LVFTFWAPTISWILIIIWWIAGKDFLPFFTLPFHSGNCFLWCAERHQSDTIPLVNSYSYFLGHWNPIKK
jgi:hypothetical protein